MSLRMEAWTPPGVADFHRRITTVDAVEISGTVVARGCGAGRIIVADDLADLPLLTTSNPDDPADDIATMMRVFDDDQHIQDWLLEPTPQPLDEDGLSELGGPDVKAALKFGVVEAFDWDGSAVQDHIQADWQYGNERNILRNGDFENNPLPNGGLEDLNTNGWEDTEFDGIFRPSGVAVANDPANARTGNGYLIVVPTTADSGARRRISGLVTGEGYEMFVWLKDPTASGKRFRVGISDASAGLEANMYEEDDYWWAELENVPNGTGSSDGTYQQTTISWDAAAEAATLVITFADTGTGPTFWVDDVSLNGEAVGLAPWHEVNGVGYLTTFDWTDVDEHGGVGAAQWQGYDRLYTSPTGQTSFGQIGIGQDVTLTPGKVYTAESWVYHESGTDETYLMILRRTTILGQGPGSSYMTSTVVTVPTNSYTPLRIDGVISDTAEISFEVRWRYGGSPDGNLHLSPLTKTDDCVLHEGLPEATLGKILVDQKASLAARGQFDWLTFDFDAALDSGGNAWDAAMKQRIRFGSNLYDLVMSAERMGYQLRMIVDDFDLGTYILQAFNPGSMGTIYTDPDDTPSLLMGQGVVAGSASRRHALHNAVTILGAGGRASRSNSAASEGAIGRREMFLFDETVDPVQASPAQLDSGLHQGLTEGLTVVPGDWARPLTEIFPADTLDVDLADGSGKHLQMIGAIGYVEPRDGQLKFTVFPDTESFSGSGAVNEGVRRLLEEKKYPIDAPVFPAAKTMGGTGGVPRVVIATADASELSKRKADVGGTGIDDPGTFDAELDEPGEIRITEGVLHVGQGPFTIGAGVYISGAGLDGSLLEIISSDVDWTFTGDNGMRFIRVGSGPGT